MSAAEGGAPGKDAPETPLDDEARDRLLAPLARCRRVLIAISGGPDSTALAWLAARWRTAMRDEGQPGQSAPPDLLAATVDHGLRADSRAEAQTVAHFCASLDMPHYILTWQGEKPAHGIQEAARAARYRLLRDLARTEGADALAVAHTRDDQAETVLFRLAHGSGLTGLAAMRPERALEGVRLLRPLLDVPKARLVATLDAAGIGFVQDPANANPRFARTRLRSLAPILAGEGLDAARLSLFARRMARADAALEAAVDEAEARLWQPQGRGLSANWADVCGLADEIALRVIGRAIARMGHEGPVELGKLEALVAALPRVWPMPGEAGTQVSGAARAQAFRRTLAGAVVEISSGQIGIFPAPPRRVGGRPG